MWRNPRHRKIDSLASNTIHSAAAAREIAATASHRR